MISSLKTHICRAALVLLALLMPMAAATAGQGSRAAYTRHYTVRDGLPNNQGRVIAELPSGQMLVRVEGAFLLSNGATFVPVACDEERSLAITGNEIGEATAQDAHGRIWVKSYEHIYVFDTHTGQFRYDADSLLRADGEPRWNYGANQLRDRQGGLWTCTFDDGISYTPPPRARATTWCAAHEVRSLALAADGTLLAGTADGLFRVDRSADSVRMVRLANCDVCLNAQTDSQGRVWFSTRDGLFCYRQGSVERVPTPVPNDTSAAFRFCTELAPNRFLLCHQLNQLYFFNPGSNALTPIQAQRALKQFRTLVWAEPEQTGHGLLLCAQNGLLRGNETLDHLQPLTDSAPYDSLFSGHSSKANCILQHRGHLWVGTQNGLLKGREWLTTEQGLPNNCIKAILPDQQGSIWATTAYGAARITLDADGRATDIISFDETDGFQTGEYQERAALLLGDTLFLGGKNGLTVLRPSIMTSTSGSLAPWIVRISTNRRADVPCYTLQGGGQLTLPHNEHFLTLVMTAFNYASPSHTRYRYMLRGIDTDWNTGRGANCELRYTALRPGRYELCYQTAVDGSPWSEMRTLVICIRPPFWLTWWACLIYIFVAAGIALAGMRIYLTHKRDKLLAEFVTSREALQNKLRDAREVPTISNRDEQFVSQLQRIVESHLDDSNFGVEALSTEAGMDRTGLYRKLQTITGQTPSEFIRQIRLNRAADLLRSNQHTVEEIAWMTGFGSTRYLRRHFKKQFGQLPSQFRDAPTD